MKQLFLALSFLFLTSCTNNAPSFEWDFSQKRQFVYSFLQNIEAENNMGQDVPSMPYSGIGKGLLQVHVKDNQLADVSLTKVKFTTTYYEEDGTPKEPTTQQLPNNVTQGMRQDGSFEDPSKEILFDLLFPLPKKDLKQGASYELPLKVPFNANGSSLYVTGTNTLTFTGYQELEGVHCAVLEGVIEVSKLDVPKEIEGTYHCKTLGKATYYFDLDNHYYIGVDLQLELDVLMDTSSKIDQETFDFYMHMKSDNQYTIRLQDIES